MWTYAEDLEAVRNLRTLAAYRKRQAGAERASRPFVMIPTLVPRRSCRPSCSSDITAAGRILGWRWPCLGGGWC